MTPITPSHSPKCNQIPVYWNLPDYHVNQPIIGTMPCRQKTSWTVVLLRPNGRLRKSWHPPNSSYFHGRFIHWLRVDFGEFLFERGIKQCSGAPERHNSRRWLPYITASPFNFANICNEECEFAVGFRGFWNIDLEIGKQTICYVQPVSCGRKVTPN